ncbi:molybdenum cofactor biosynthesis protein MoaE [Histidinibacterium lentulum]|uniref:Molybdopterin synthase catalytic subunit n=1 Tax=Histidinibacterium lentulum TaxID=2480588 RepID=A0A3N2QVT5_9RHOB|nr:molybdenum cofactor biosynthesis protein MoaE [Histidinibacterium lentulum]ROT99351.1 molybdenum cofactor biosynthesis protein MoaE [Histidinibacterium lentulum]
MEVTVQEAPFDPGAQLSAFTAAAEGAGAVVSFTGIVRDLSGGLDHMEIEHYPAMTERALEEIRTRAVSRFGLTGAWIIHRFGRLSPGETIMMVLTAAPHRADAFAGADFLMDYLKSRAPFWKKEVTGETETWVAARDEDEDALRRW